MHSFYVCYALYSHFTRPTAGENTIRSRFTKKKTPSNGFSQFESRPGKTSAGNRDYLRASLNHRHLALDVPRTMLLLRAVFDDWRPSRPKPFIKPSEQTNERTDERAALPLPLPLPFRLLLLSSSTTLLSLPLPPPLQTNILKSNSSILPAFSSSIEQLAHSFTTLSVRSLSRRLVTLLQQLHHL